MGKHAALAGGAEFGRRSITESLIECHHPESVTRLEDEPDRPAVEREPDREEKHVLFDVRPKGHVVRACLPTALVADEGGECA